MVAAFVLFRAFDIAKPLGIRKMESLRGGVGVMMDDILAVSYTHLDVYKRQILTASVLSILL